MASGFQATWSSYYRTTLENRRIVIDDYGIEMPAPVRTLVAEYLFKDRLSPRLADHQISSIQQAIQTVRSLNEASINEIISSQSALFPIRDIVGVAKGTDALWTPQGLPFGTGGLLRAKTVHYLGFPNGLPRAGM